MNRFAPISKRVIQLVQKRRVHTMDPVKDTKGWTYDSPNLAQYNALKASLVSITARGLLLWNLVMLIAEVTLYPNDVETVVTNQKVQ